MPHDTPHRNLSAKLSAPMALPSQITRARLTNLVCQEPAPRLVLIRAPAGFGKTTMMLQCKQQLDAQGVRTAWLTLDTSDNDVTRFLECLCAALQDLIVAPVADRRPEDYGFDLLGQIGQSMSPFALFIDEFEVMQEPGVLGFVRSLIDHVPPGSSIVLGSRSVPDLGLGKMRARGQLIEIDARLLRLTAAEAEEFLGRHTGLALTPAELELARRKTEGWAAGLWLLSTALTHQETHAEYIARFSGTHLAVADYLTTDVLNMQTPEVRDFLLRTSILRELSPLLCLALVPQVDAEAMLRRLAAENVLVSPIGGDEHRYRLHGLFADLLQAQLKRELTETELSLLHRRAAQGFESQQRPVPAIDHALEAGDTDHALRLLEEHAMSLLSGGRHRLLTRWFDTLPEAALAAHPLLRAIQIWAIGYTRGPWEALTLLDRSGLDSSDDRGVQLHVMALRPVLLQTMDSSTAQYESYMNSLAWLPSGDAFIDNALLTTLAAMNASRGLSSEARRLLDMRRTAQPNVIGDMYDESIEGTMALFEGRLREATTRFRVAIEISQVRGSGKTHGNAWAGVLYAAAVYEANDSATAMNLLRIYVPLARDAGIPDHVTLGYRMLARIAFQSGDVDQALRMLAELESLGHQRQLLRVVASARLERSRLQLMQGHFQAARDELERASVAAIWEPLAHLNLIANNVDYPRLNQLRWEAHAGDRSKAIDDLDLEIGVATAARRHFRALKLRIIRSVALDLDGRSDLASQSMLEVLKDCHAEGFARIVIDEGPAAGALVKRLFGPVQSVWRVNESADFTAWMQRLRQSFDTMSPEEPETRAAMTGAIRPPPDPAASPYQAELLTRKEQRVLKLLAEGYSNAAMSDKLFVSDSTVRTHLRSINSKLGVRGRMQAVAVARDMGLLR